MTESAYKPSLIRQPPKLTSPLHTLSDYVRKFAAYHPHYKDKHISNPTRTFACIARLGLVAKQGKTPKVVLYLHSHPLQPPSSLLSSTLSECAVMFTWQFSLNLASLLADYLSVKLTSQKAVKAVENRKYLTSTQNLPDASFDLSCVAQTAKFSPNNNDLSSQIGYVICLADTVNKANIIHWSSMKCKRVTRGILAVELYAMTPKFDINRFDIEKLHWGRYQIVQAKSHQHKHYGMSEQACMK